MSTPEQPLAPKDALAREEAERGSAGIVAVLAGLLTLGGGIVASLIYADFPHVPLLTTLRESLGQGLQGAPGLKSAQILFYSDHSNQLLVVSLVLAAGSLLTGYALRYMYRVTSARTSRLPKIALVAAIAGPIMVAVSELGLQIFVSYKSGQFADASDHGTQAAHDALKGGALVAATLLRQLGVLVVGLAFVLINLNAMRVGLLTRFMGILGIIAGVLFVIPLGSQLPVVQTFWLVALGFLILQRWPGGNVPLSWRSGKPEPWPTQQEIKAQRAKDVEDSKVAKAKGTTARPERAPRTPFPLPRPGGGRKAAAEPAPIVEAEDAEDDEPTGPAHSSSKKKKRKRR